MIPYGRQHIDKKDIQSVVKALKSAWLTQGPVIAWFERKLARAAGAKYAVSVSSGTAALHLAYLAAGLKKGDEVITSPNTFAATSNMLLAAGARPVFCDIRLDTYNIDETKLEKLITRKTRAIVSVDFAGHPVEYEKISRIARKHSLIFISDACHALGAKYRGRSVGSLADMTVFSFHPVKSITTGEGGAILTDSPKYYAKAKLLRSHGVTKNKQGRNVMTDFGFNYRLTDIQAALGISQLKKLEKFIKLRNRVANWYFEELKGIEEIILPNYFLSFGSTSPGLWPPSPSFGRGWGRGRKVNGHAWHLFVIRVKNPKHQQPLRDYLISKGIGANFHYPAVYSHPYYQKIGYQKTRLLNEEIYQQSCLTLPCFPQMTREQVRYVSKLVKEFFKKNAQAN